MDRVPLTHPDSPGSVVIELPMNMGLVGNVLVKLGELGFILPDAVGTTKITLDLESQPNE